MKTIGSTSKIVVSADGSGNSGGHRALRQALAIRRDLGDLHGEAETLRNLSQIHQARGELDITLDCYRQALAIWTNIGNQEAAAATLGRMESLSP